MKKQTQKAATKTTKKTTKTTAAEVAWHVRAQALPLALFHTTVGPIIGRAEAVSDPLTKSFGVRVWAPAVVQMGFQPGRPGVMCAQYAVTFQPIALVETHFDLSTSTPVGRSPVPAALVPGYLEYFDRVVTGEYTFNRIVQHVEQAIPHVTPVVSTPSETSEAPSFPWPEGSDHYDWLTRKVYFLAEEEVLDRDDARRILVKRALLGWAFLAEPQKIATSFDLDVDNVQFAYNVIDELFPAAQDKERIKKLLPQPTSLERVEDESVVS